MEVEEEEAEGKMAEREQRQRTDVAVFSSNSRPECEEEREASMWREEQRKR